MFYDRIQNLESISYPPENEASAFELFKNFLDANPKTGYLIFQVTQDSPLQGTLPVANAKITVSKLLGSNFFVSRVLKTGNDGKTNPIPLPTVYSALSTTPGNGKVYSTYSARVEAPDFITTDIFDIQVFDGITSIQPVKLLPSIVNSTQHTYKTDPQNLSKSW